MTTPAARQRRKDIAGILWLLLAQRRQMLACTRIQKGILHDAAWHGYDTICRQISLVRGLADDGRAQIPAATISGATGPENP